MEKTCKTCEENDNGLCDRTGCLVEDDDQCEKWKDKKNPGMERKDDEHISGWTLRGGQK